MKAKLVAVLLVVVLMGHAMPVSAKSCRANCGSVLPKSDDSGDNALIIAGGTLGILAAIGLGVWIIKRAHGGNSFTAMAGNSLLDEEPGRHTVRYGLKCPQTVKSLTWICW